MKKTMVLMALLLAVSAAACGKKEEAPPANTPAPTASSGTGGSTAANGQAIYKQNCVSCHGDTLQGGVGPNLTKVGAKYQKDQIVTIVTNGKGAMPSFKGKLSDSEIGSIADWLSTQK